MKTKFGVLKAVVVGVAGLVALQAQADVIKNAARVGGYELGISDSLVPLTPTGATGVTFTGSGKFTIFYTAECAASGYVDVDIYVDGVPLAPTAPNNEDSFCDFETRGAMHTATGRTGTLATGTHTVQIQAHKSEGVAFLSDSSLLIAK
jgi:hypothetical protein